MSKSILAKLLATENLRVEYQNVRTASFNLENRVITLPIWNDTTPEIDDLLIGHEVGHAIDTPLEYIDLAKAGPTGFGGFLNVVEDARIERLIKNRYPGLRKAFSKGYAQFLERDFFDLKEKSVDKMLLIDRINMYFKLGPMFPISFTQEEKVYIDRIEKCETFDEVKQIANDLYGYCKEELEKKLEEEQEEFQQKLQSGEFDDEMEEYDFGESNGMTLDDDNFEDGEDGEDELESGFESQYEKSWSHESGAREFQPSKELRDYDELKSVTDENLQKSIQNLSEKKEIKIGKLPSNEQYEFSKIIVSYKKILGKIYDLSEVNSIDDDCMKNQKFNKLFNAKALLEFESKNKNAISYLVKEFEMKKRAAELRRVTVSDTGVIDTNKLHTYKFNDDIFRKVGSVAAGKNHGIMFFIDWSGSMSDNIKGTVEQLITLTQFCRKVNIPFEVYAFSTEWNDSLTDAEKIIPVEKEKHIVVDNRFNLLNFFSSRMSNSEYRKMANDLLNYADIRNDFYFGRHCISDGMGLGGTPLNQTILAAIKMVPKYQKANRLEVVDVVFLTDGEDSQSENVYGKLSEHVSPYDNKKHRHTISIDGYSRFSVSYVEDDETGKKYRVGSSGVTDTFLRILKEKTNCNLIGFYILNKSKTLFNRAVTLFGGFSSEEDFKSFKSEKFFEVTTYGYDKYFLIPGGNDLSVEDESLEDIIGETQVSNRKLKSAFLKMNRNRLINRVFLSKTIDELV